jgi:ankyrin repeat protein
MDAFASALHAGDVAATRRALESSEHVREHINDPLFDFGQRAAHIAATNTGLLDVLIAFGADVNLRSEWKNGPYTVLDNCTEDSARFLISRGARITPHVAARLGWFDELRQIVETDPSVVQERGGDGQQPLHFSATVDIADYLLDRGADVDARCIDHSSTPAQYALVERPDVCRRLLQRGATPDVFMPCRLGDVRLAERLLDDDPACVNARVHTTGYPPVPPFNTYCWSLGFLASPHEVALKYAHQDVHDLLVRRSPPRVRLLDAAMRGDEPAARAALTQDPSVPVSLRPDEHALLAHAIFHGRDAAAEVMLGLGFDPTVRGVDGGTALHMACWMGRARLVERLLQGAGVPLGEADPTHGSTPLAWAVFGSVHRRADGADYIGVIDRLVRAGANVSAPGNKYGASMLDLADGNAAVQEALRRHGAI